MSINTQCSINWVEQGYVSDSIVRKGIRRLLKQRLDEIHAGDAEISSESKQLLLKQ